MGESRPAVAGASGSPRPGSRVSIEVGALVAVVTIAAGATILATSRYGMAMNSDAVEYRVGAQNLADGLGYTRNGRASTIFPPGYSAVLSIGERLGIDTVDGARWLAVVAFAATTVLGFVLLRRHVRSTNIVVAGTVMIGCSAVLLSVFEVALSDSLFIVVVLLLLLVAEELADRPRSLWLLGGAAVLLWAAFYLRYAGLILVVFMALVVLLVGWPHGRARALARAAGLVIVGLSVPALWVMRNIDAGRGAMGVRRDAEASVLTNVARSAVTLIGWTSFQGPIFVRVVVSVAVFGVALAVVALLLPIRAQVIGRARDIWPLAGFVTLYIAYLIATASVVAFAPIYTRYLIPVYVPIVVLGAWAFEGIRSHLEGSWRSAVTAVAVVWVAANVVWFGVYVTTHAREGAGHYATSQWHNSPLMREVEHWDRTVPLVTNDYNAVQLFTGRHVTETVAKSFIGSNEASGRLAAFVERVRCERRIGLAWFTGPGTRTRLYSPKELSEFVHVGAARRLSDGVIYYLTPLPESNGTGGQPEQPCPDGARAGQ